MARIFFALLTLSILAINTSLYAQGGTPLQQALMNTLDHKPVHAMKIDGHGYTTEQIEERLLTIYQEQGMTPFWVTESGPTARGQAVFETLKTSFNEGLDPNDYYVKSIEKYWGKREPTSLAILDILLSLGVGGYIADMTEGSMDARKADPKLFATARDTEYKFGQGAGLLRAANVNQYLSAQGPQHIYYKNLKKVLKTYRNYAANGGWQNIPAGQTLKPGMTDSRIPLVRKRLSIVGDLNGSDLNSQIYDQNLEAAVRSFQHRWGIEEDGVIGKGTLEIMNVSAADLVKKITANLERWRWMAHKLEGKQIFVNIAGFELAGASDEHIELRMPVIVGKTYHKTPVFSDMIKYVEINPFWNIPNSIARNETLAHLKKDSSYTRKKGIRIFSGWGGDAKEIDPTSINWNNVSKSQMNKYHLRQDPGPKNALGTLKVIFPNSHNVYLHDTPTHSLFTKTERAFSHGCIRMSEPAKTAAYVLGGEGAGWTEERVKQIVASKKRTIVNLEQPMPVHIAYRTAGMDLKTGKAFFRKDIYGRDKALIKALYG